MEEADFFARMARELRNAADDCASMQVDMVIGVNSPGLRDDNIVSLQRLDRVTQILTDLSAVLDMLSEIRTREGELTSDELRRVVRLRSLYDRLNGNPAPGIDVSTAAQDFTLF